MAALVFIAGSFVLSRNMNETADSIGSSTGQDHQPRPNTVPDYPKGPVGGTTGSSGISGSQTTNVPPAAR